MLPRSLLLALMFFISAFAGAQEDATPTSTRKKVLVLEESKVIARQASKDYDKGDFASAEKKYQQLLSIAPHDIDCLNHLAAVETRLNKPEEAERLLKESIQQKLENPFAWLLLGMTYLDQKRMDEAFAAFVQAVLYDPKNPRAQHYLGVAAGRKQWHEIAEASLRKAIELDPNYGEAHFNLAVYYIQHNPPATEVARRHYQKALDLGIPHDANMDAILQKPIADSK